jgi:hypothetical protein
MPMGHNVMRDMPSRRSLRAPTRQARRTGAGLTRAGGRASVALVAGFAR